MFGCAKGEDSIEHYAGCLTVRVLAEKFLRLAIPAGDGLAYFMFVHGALADKLTLLRTATLVYATYRTTERLRRAGFTEELGAMDDMMQQAAREGVRGHLEACQALDGL